MKTQKTNSFSKAARPSLLLVPYILWSQVSVAQISATESLSIPVSNLSHKSTGWSAGLLYGFVAYTEPSFMIETGSLSGLSLSYTYAFRENPVVLRAEGEYLYGQLTYNGSTWAGQPLTTSAGDNMLNGRALLGFQIQPTYRLNVMPFVGIAARYLNDQIQNSYDREITYFYVPIGANFTFSVAKSWAASVGGEYDKFISGNAVSHLDQTNSAYPTVDNSQSNGYGYRLTVGIENSMESGWVLKVSPYLYYWNVQQSDVQTFAVNSGSMSVIEPSNASTMYGVNVSLVF